MADATVKRHLGHGMPTGPNDLSQYRFTVTPWHWTVAKLMTFGADTLRYQIAEQTEKTMGGAASRPNNDG